MIILGVDPGLADTGYGLIKIRQSQYQTLAYGAIRTSADLDFSERLFVLHQELSRIIKKYQPERCAIEELFFYKNIKTALQVAQARGVILLTAIQAQLPLFEFTPLEIKQALTSYGRADKQQVQKMVKTILKIKIIPKPDDAADALAAAICCAQTKDFV